MTEAGIQDAIGLAAHSLGLVLWRNNVGLAVDGPRKIRYGLAVGSSDLIGLLVPEGRFVALDPPRSKSGSLHSFDAQAGSPPWSAPSRKPKPPLTGRVAARANEGMEGSEGLLSPTF